jgi:hypothetical protein
MGLKAIVQLHKAAVLGWIRVELAACASWQHHQIPQCDEFISRAVEVKVKAYLIETLHEKHLFKEVVTCESTSSAKKVT